MSTKRPVKPGRGGDLGGERAVEAGPDAQLLCAFADGSARMNGFGGSLHQITAFSISGVLVSDPLEAEGRQIKAAVLRRAPKARQHAAPHGGGLLQSVARKSVLEDEVAHSQGWRPRTALWSSVFVGVVAGPLEWVTFTASNWGMRVAMMGHA